MKRNQLIILISGIVLVILIYQLPKALVSNEKELKQEKESVSSSPEPAFQSSHSAKLDDNQLSKLAFYKKQFNSFSNPEKKINFADSIADIFKKIGSFDSSAYYYGIIADQTSNELVLEKAGDAYFEAFSASNGENKVYNDKARNYFEGLLKQHPENHDVKAKLAMTYVATENPMQGISLLREILKDDPENERALYNMGILSMQSGQHDKAIDRFKDLLKVNPENSSARFYLGLAYLNSGKTRKAKEEFEKAKQLETDPAFISIVDGYLKDIK